MLSLLAERVENGYSIEAVVKTKDFSGEANDVT